MDLNLKLTEKATAKIKEYQEKMPEAKGKFFRVYVQGGGCSGFSYGFVFDEKRDDDFNLQTDNVAFLVDPQSAMYLNDCIVDFVESLTNSGFSVENPNASGKCGCGSSFSV